MALDMGELKGLDINDIGSWPFTFKAIVIFMVCVLILAGGYWFDIKDQDAAYEGLVAKQESLKEEFKTKQLRAVNLEAYRQQMKEMEESFGAMLRQLPSKTEVPDLLVEVTQTGLSAGLTFDLFKPENEIQKDFYAELPVSVRVMGNFHQFGTFVSNVAALPRIVTLHELDIKSEKGKDSSGLVLSATAKTYRYLDEEELAASKAAEKGKNKNQKKR